MKKWIYLQIVLALGDLLTTPWNDMSSEMNPLIRWGGLPLMILAKILAIAGFAYWYNRLKGTKYLSALITIAIAPASFVVVWNTVGLIIYTLGG